MACRGCFVKLYSQKGFLGSLLRDWFAALRRTVVYAGHSNQPLHDPRRPPHGWVATHSFIVAPRPGRQLVVERSYWLRHRAAETAA